MMLLAIDAGNTRIKWGVRQEENWAALGSVAVPEAPSLEPAWSYLPSDTAVIGSNVAGEGARQIMEGILERRGLRVRWIAPRAQGFGITCRYDTAQLGSDRWAALVAARRLCPQSCLVVSSGTALTVDALTAQGEFLGGIIVPGFDLMRTSLAGNTAALGLRDGRAEPFPRNTGDAIASGAIQALCGAVERMAGHMQTAGAPPALCLLSGGGAPLLEPHLRLPVRRVEHLALEGLIVMARD